VRGQWAFPPATPKWKNFPKKKMENYTGFLGKLGKGPLRRRACADPETFPDGHRVNIATV
jgi:hypothetical protein